MIEKNEENTDDNNLVRIRLIADKRTFLEKQFLQVQEEIKICFAQLAETLCAREKQLLRQSEAIYRQQVSLALSSQETLPPSLAILNEKDALEEQIKQFGRIALTGSNTTAVTDLEPYKIVEYQDVNKDHVCFDKSINSTGILPQNKNNEFPCATDDENVKHMPIGLKTSSEINLISKSNYTPSIGGNISKKSVDISSKTDAEVQRNDSNIQTANGNEQEHVNNNKNLRKTITEEQHNSHGHTEQVQQWLDQILLETEIEPTIHEVEQLPELSESYVCTKLQLET